MTSMISIFYPTFFLFYPTFKKNVSMKNLPHLQATPQTGVVN